MKTRVENQNYFKKFSLFGPNKRGIFGRLKNTNFEKINQYLKSEPKYNYGVFWKKRSQILRLKNLQQIRFSKESDLFFVFYQKTVFFGQKMIKC